MDEEEDRTFGLCKCCLQDGCFRSLWVPYNEDGTPNYGEMLNECFSLHWEKPDNIHLEQICDDCVKRTEDAFGFRRQVLASQVQLEYDIRHTVEIEVLDSESGHLIIVKEESVKMEPDSDEAPEGFGEDGGYETIEYLEVENSGEEFVDDPQPHVPETKKGQRKRNRMRTYKNYSNEDFKQCIEAVHSGRMTIAVAAAHYNVPRKTVSSKILSDKRGEVTTVKADKNFEFVKEIKTLLTYTNMTPYKSRTAHYHCAYCSTDGPLFEDPDVLRTHTRTHHAEERTKVIAEILKPLWLNEVLKVDIENLHCTICCVVLVSWNDMFKHLNEQHNLEFDEAYNRVIPYILKSELRCALCKALFPNYHQLDAHMNAHYSSYVCSDCGDTFLSASRLKKHLKIHNTGRFPCEQCGKVYNLEIYRKKHIELVHRQNENIRCLYCPEKFVGSYSRHLHVMERHPGKTKIITCEMCGKIFDWRPYFLAHIRRKHNKERNYSCSICDATFFMKSEVKRHEASHRRKNSDRSYVCAVCGERYRSSAELVTHQNSHEIELELKDIDTL